MQKTEQRMTSWGMPTGPDVRRIREKFPDSLLVEGETEIAYEEIAEVIYESIDSNRFRTVTMAWRRAVQKDSGKIIKCQNGNFVVIDDSGKLGEVKSRVRSAGKNIRVAKNVGSLIDRKNLTKDETYYLEREEFRLSKMAEANRLASKTEVPKLGQEETE
jgi:hypothetical protein